MGGQPVSYAVRKDGLGWRAVENATDCADDEVWQEAPPVPALPTHAQLVAQTLTRTREERQPIIGVLDGLQASASAKGEGSTALTIEAVKQGLRDITKSDLSTCTTAEEMRAAVMAAYAALVTSNPTVALAFKGVLA